MKGSSADESLDVRGSAIAARSAFTGPQPHERSRVAALSVDDAMELAVSGDRNIAPIPMTRNPTGTDWACMAGVGTLAGWLPMLAAPWLTRLDFGIVDANQGRFLHVRRNGWSPVLANGSVHEYPIHEIHDFSVYSFYKRRGDVVKSRDLVAPMSNDPRHGRGWSLKPQHVVLLNTTAAVGGASFLCSPYFDDQVDAEAAAAGLNAGIQAARRSAAVQDPSGGGGGGAVAPAKQAPIGVPMKPAEEDDRPEDPGMPALEPSQEAKADDE